MEGIEVGSSESSSSSTSGSHSLASASTINSSVNSSLEVQSSLFTHQAFEERREAVVEPSGVPVAAQSTRTRRLLDFPSFRVRTMQRDRPTLPTFDDVNRSSLHPALRARPSSPVMTVPVTHSTTARSAPSVPPTVDTLSAAIERARAFDASMEPLRRSPADPSTLPSASSRLQQSLPRPRARGVASRPARALSDEVDSDNEDLDLPPVFNGYSGRERLLSVGNPVIPTMPTSPDVELSPFSVGPLDSASRPGPGTASNLLRRRLETASQQAEHGSPSRRLPRLQTREQQLFAPQSTQAPALYPSSTWSRDVLYHSRESVGPSLNSLHDHVNSLIGELNSPSILRPEEQEQRMDASVSQPAFFDRLFQPQQAGGEDLTFRNGTMQRQVRRRPRTLLNSINRMASPDRSTPTRQMEPAAALRRLLETDRPQPMPEPRFDSIFASGEIQRERVLPPPTTNSGRQSVRPVSNTSETDRERFTRYTSDLSGVVDRESARAQTPAYNPPPTRISSRLLRRPSLLDSAREMRRCAAFLICFPMYDGEVEREADHLARLRSTLPGIRSQCELKYIHYDTF